MVLVHQYQLHSYTVEMEIKLCYHISSECVAVSYCLTLINAPLVEGGTPSLDI